MEQQEQQIQESPDLWEQFTAARNAYPRPAWVGDAMWQLVERQGTLVLQETRKGWLTRHNHWGYTVSLQQKGA